MKINRSSKIHFGKWLTKEKKSNISLFLDEYSKIVNYFISNYLEDSKTKEKKELLLAQHIQKCITVTETWLYARTVKNAFAEGYGMCQSYHSNKENDETHNIPVHTGKKAILSCTNNTQSEETHTVEFDFNTTLICIGNKMKISIPLKKHKQFNKWNSVGKRSSSIVLTRNYVQFSFEIETGTKKEEGNLLGVDIGLKNLIADSSGNFIGTELTNMILSLHRKKQHSKGWNRKREEIKEYIDRCCKEIPFETIQLLVVEKLKDVKKNMKVKRRLTKSVRRVISNWNYAYVLKRLQELCEVNRVSFNRVSPFYTSQDCSSCGYRDKKNRQDQEHFVCQRCGHADNADTNAARNILGRFLAGKYGSRYKLEIIQKEIFI